MREPSTADQTAGLAFGRRILLGTAAWLALPAGASATVTVTGITLTPATSSASSSANTTVGTLATLSSGALVNPIFSLLTTAGGPFRLVGAQVELNVNKVPAGCYSVMAQVSADNAATFSQSVLITIGATLVSNLPTALSLTNSKAAAVAAGSPVTIGHAFARGDVPAGSHVKILFGTTTMPVQQDQESYWSDGSLKFAALALSPAETFAGNGGADTRAYTVQSEATPPVRTAAFTLTQLTTATDFKVLFTGFDCGTDTLSCSLNDIVGRFRAPPWDAGPLALTAAAATGATTLNVANAAQISLGMLVSGTGVAANTLVTAISGNAVTISPALTGAVASGAFLTFNSPLGGWEQVRSGALCMEWRAWSYLRVVGGANAGEYHTQIRCTLYVRSWGLNGPHEVYAQLDCPNIHGNIPAGSVGPSSGTYSLRFVSEARVMNGSTVLMYFGGANDARARVIPNANFNTTDGSVTLPGGVPIGAFGFSLSSTGTLPGALQPNTPYWMCGIVGKSYIMKSRAASNGGGNWTPNTYYDSHSFVVANAGVYRPTANGTCGSIAPTGATAKDGQITWQLVSGTQMTRQGSGTITLLPTLTVWPACSAALATTNGEPIWVPGTSRIAVRPHMLPSYDNAYLTKKTKMVPPLDTEGGLTTYARTSGQIHDRGLVITIDQYQPGQYQTWYWKISNYGDDPGDERVGVIQNSQALQIFQPKDKFNDLLMRSIALGFGDYPAFLKNDQSGLPFAVNAGPNNSPSGAQYPGLGKVETERSINTYSTFPFLGAASNQGDHWSGQENTYGPLVDASHMPNLYHVPYLTTGHRIYLDNMQNLACSLIASVPSGSRNVSVTGKKYYGAFTSEAYGGMQLRAKAWLLKTVAQAEFMTPSTDLLLPYLKDILDANADYLGRFYPANIQPQQLATLGLTEPVGEDSGRQKIDLYMYNFFGAVVAWQAWRDMDERLRPGWRAFMLYSARLLVTVFDTDMGGGFYNLTAYYGRLIICPIPNLQFTYQTPADVWMATGVNKPSAPGFAGNIYRGDAPFDTVDYTTCWAACVAIMAWAATPKAKVLWQRWYNAIHTAPNSPIVWALNASHTYYNDKTPQSYVPWAFVAPPAPPDYVPMPPGAVTGLTVETVRATTVSASYSPPAMTATNHVGQSSTDGTTWVNNAGLFNARGGVFTGLTQNTAYQLRVVASNFDGGSNSSVVSATTLAIPPGNYGVLSFAGVAGAPTGDQVLSAYNNADVSAALLDGAGNLNMPAPPYALGTFSNVGTLQDGTFTYIYKARSMRRDVILIVRVNPSTLTYVGAVIGSDGGIVFINHVNGSGPSSYQQYLSLPANPGDYTGRGRLPGDALSVGLRVAGAVMTVQVNGIDTPYSMNTGSVTADGFVGVGNSGESGHTSSTAFSSITIAARRTGAVPSSSIPWRSSN